MAQKIIFKCVNNHVPDEIFRLARDNDVFYRDDVTGELIQVLDLQEAKSEKAEERF